MQVELYEHRRLEVGPFDLAVLDPGFHLCRQHPCIAMQHTTFQYVAKYISKD